MIFIVGRGQGAIEDYFDHNVELETQLSKPRARTRAAGR